MTASRYAPSPTGELHLGNIRTALLAWLQARLSGSRFVLRIEDLDLPRVKPGSAKQIIDDLHWLGLDFDEAPSSSDQPDQYYQSQRDRFYHKALLKLHAKQLIYPCYCSRKDIQQAASAPHAGLPVYPRTCYNSYPTVTPGNEVEINGRLPAWRFKVDNEPITFKDKLQGQFSQNLLSDVGDFVIRRSDGLFAYQLAVVVDDIQMAVTDVLRGEDLLDSSCRQIALYNALDAPPVQFWHVKLMTDSKGKRLSKRDGSDSLAQLRALGQNPDQVVSMLALSCNLIDQQTPMSTKQLLEQLTLDEFIFKLKEGQV